MFFFSPANEQLDDEIKRNIEEDKKLFQDKTYPQHIRIYPYRVFKTHEWYPDGEVKQYAEKGMVTCPA